MSNDVLAKAEQVVPCDGIGCQRDALVGVDAQRLLVPDEVAHSRYGRAYLCARHFWEQTDPDAQQ